MLFQFTTTVWSDLFQLLFTWAYYKLLIEYFTNFLLCNRYWVTEMHVDGFRFDLASIMTRSSR